MATPFPLHFEWTRDIDRVFLYPGHCLRNGVDINLFELLRRPPTVTPETELVIEEGGSIDAVIIMLAVDGADAREVQFRTDDYQTLTFAKKTDDPSLRTIDECVPVFGDYGGERISAAMRVCAGINLNTGTYISNASVIKVRQLSNVKASVVALKPNLTIVPKPRQPLLPNFSLAVTKGKIRG